MNCQNQISDVSAFEANKDVIQTICAEIDGNAGSSIPQSVLIIGQEGSGKTSLLKRVISKYKNSNFLWIDGRSIFNSSDIIEQASGNSILIIDDLDYYLNRCAYEEQYVLRRFLFNEGAPMLIASVSKLTKTLTEYKAPFFEGLKKIHLSPISPKDITLLFDKNLTNRAVAMFNLLSPTIQSIGIISNVIQLNANPDNDIKSLLSFFEDKYKLIYESVPLNSQRILNILGGNDTGLNIPAIRERSNLASGILTSYLKSLCKQNIISADKSIKRNTKYFVKDPLFRIWLNKETQSY